MDAIAKIRSERGLDLVEVPVPEVGDEDVLIRVTHSAICGTDLHIYLWDEWASKTVEVPRVIGHEYVGVIEKVGKLVKNFKEGERVTSEGHISCGRCPLCLQGLAHNCPYTKGTGVERDGCFAQYVCVPATNVWKADERISDKQWACFDPFGNAVHAALEFDVVGKDVLVTGAGPVGCMSAAVARRVGARNVVVTDISDYRLEIAKKMGATMVVNPMKESLKEAIKELNLEVGFEVGLEMSGSAKALNEDMIPNMANCGEIVLMGIVPEGTALDYPQVIFRGLTMKGLYGRRMYETWYQATGLAVSGLDLNPLITHEFHYKEYEKAFELMEAGQCGKIILNWTQ